MIMSLPLTTKSIGIVEWLPSLFARFDVMRFLSLGYFKDQLYYHNPQNVIELEQITIYLCCLSEHSKWNFFHGRQRILSSDCVTLLLQTVIILKKKSVLQFFLVSCSIRWRTLLVILKIGKNKFPGFLSRMQQIVLTSSVILLSIFQIVDQFWEARHELLFRCLIECICHSL